MFYNSLGFFGENHMFRMFVSTLCVIPSGQTDFRKAAVRRIADEKNLITGVVHVVKCGSLENKVATFWRKICSSMLFGEIDRASHDPCVGGGWVVMHDLSLAV